MPSLPGLVEAAPESPPTGQLTILRAMRSAAGISPAWSGFPEMEPIEVVELAVQVYRAPVSRPVRTSFGLMKDRPAVLIRVRNRDGVAGYGEVWCNFPAPAAEYRASIVCDVLAPRLLGRSWSDPKSAFDELSVGTRSVAVQAGEPGPFSQAIAGIDIALWDLAARRAGQPLRCYIGGRGNGRVPAYASGIGPEEVVRQALEARSAGHRAYKLKVGFGSAVDLANLASLRRELGEDATIAVDANQAWSPIEAVRRCRELAPYFPEWLEEPIGADHQPAEWRLLAEASPIPLAAGENVRGRLQFDRMIRREAVAVIQPDVAKWGGISGCLPVARRALVAGRRYCPHYLGGGIGLLASAHLLDAVGGDGMLEVDCNPNPLREGLAEPFPPVGDGHLLLSDAPGLGVEPSARVSHLAVERVVRTRARFRAPAGRG